MAGTRWSAAALAALVAAAAGDAGAAGEALDAAGPVGERWGFALASLGDLDGDGVAEIAVGSPDTSTAAGGNAGRVTVIDGATGVEVFRYDGTVGGQGLGRFVASAGDFDGDGVVDLLAGAPGTTDTRKPPGYVVVVSGATHAALATFAGVFAGASFGSAAAVVGDVTGDGVPDVVVGEPRSGSGFVRGYSGASGAPIATLQLGGAPDEELGTSVAAVGDLDGDGTPDFAAGAPKGNPVAAMRGGRIVVFSGATGSQLRVINGRAPSQLGLALAAGDFDGDGRTDLAASGRSATGGFVAVHSFQKKVAPKVVPSPAGVQEFGTVLAAMPDLDGVPGREVAVGSIGSVHVLSFGGGAATGIARIDGAAESSFGTALAPATDLAGTSVPLPDGVPDIAVGDAGTGHVTVHPLVVGAASALPSKLAFGVHLRRGPSAPSAAKGHVSLVVKKGVPAFDATWSGLAAGSHTFHIEEGVGTNTFREIGAGTGGKGKFKLTGGKGALPAALATTDPSALGGRFVQMRDGTEVVLEAMLPYAGDLTPLRSTIPLSPTGDGAGLTGSLKFTYDPKTGSQKLDLRLKGAAAGETLELVAERSPGSGEYEKVGDVSGGRLTADAASGFWPFPRDVRPIDAISILRYLVLRSSTAVLTQAVAAPPDLPDLVVSKVDIQYAAVPFDRLALQCKIKNIGAADVPGDVNVRVKLEGVVPGPPVLDEVVRVPGPFPKGQETSRLGLVVLDNPNGIPPPPTLLILTVTVDATPSPASSGEYLESDETNNVRGRGFEFADGEYDED